MNARVGKPIVLAIVLGLPALAATWTYRAEVTQAMTPVVTAASPTALASASGATTSIATTSLSGATARGVTAPTASALSVTAPAAGIAPAEPQTINSTLAALSCAGFTTDSAALARVPDILLLPETGTLGRSALRRTRVDYAARGNGVTVLRKSGVCPTPVPLIGEPSMCGLDGGTTVVPKPGAALTHWGAQFSANTLSVTVKRASDVAAGRPGVVWNAGARRSGFVGFCADAGNPIVEMRIGGQGIALTHIKHAFSPLGRPVDLGLNPTRERRALAAQVEFERAVVALQMRERAQLPEAKLIAKYAPLLGLPATTSFNTLMQSVLRGGTYAEAFAIDLQSLMAPIKAATAQGIELKRAELTKFYASIGYTPQTLDQTSDLLPASLTAGISSNALPAPATIAGLEQVLFSPLSLEFIYINNSAEFIGGPSKFCEGGGTCVNPLPYDLVPRWIDLRWHSSSLTKEQVEDIVAENGYRMEMRINGHLLNFGPSPAGGGAANPGQAVWATTYLSPTMCRPNETCFSTFLLSDGITSAGKLAQIPFPWEIQFKVYKLNPAPPTIVGVDELGNPKYAEKKKDLLSLSVVQLLPNPNPAGSYFLDAIYPTYAHGRCAQCHSFEVPEAVNDHHSFARGAAIQLRPSSFVSGAHVMACNNCHEGFLPSYDAQGNHLSEQRWRVPYIDLDVNWGAMTPREACLRTVQHLPSEYDRREHFHEDARLFWAIESGELPSGGPLPTAPPFDFEEFLLRVDAWSKNSTPCPSN